MSTSTTEARSGQVRSIIRATTILRVLSDAPEGLSLSETASRASLAASTAHRILTTLESERFVRFDNGSGCWQIGVAAFTIGAGFARSRDMLSFARPFVRRLMERTGETANIFLETSGEVICMAQVESRHSMRALTRVGGRVKMHWSGAGKAILAHLPEARAKEILEEQGMTRATHRTITSWEAMREELHQIRKSGISIDNEENTEGMRCVAGVILDENKIPVGAISISGPTARVTEEKLPMLSSVVASVAAEVTREYGGAAFDGDVLTRHG